MLILALLHMVHAAPLHFEFVIICVCHYILITKENLKVWKKVKEDIILNLLV